MMAWLGALADFYRQTPYEALPEQVRRQMKRCLLDATGCMLAAAEYTEEAERLTDALGVRGCCRIPGSGRTLHPAWAGFLGSVEMSALEADDATSVGASVHPGCCVIPAALAAAQVSGADGKNVLKAMAFGYDLCNRLGLAATEKIREFGLYGPGMIAAPCGAAVYGFLTGQNEDQMENALSVALSMMPLCPFSAFTDGASCKNLYTGWGTYLGICAALMQEMGVTGPRHIFSGEKSLAFLFTADQEPIFSAPAGAFADAVVFKNYAACLSVGPTLAALDQLCAQEPLVPEHIAEMTVQTYPYAVQLSGLTDSLNAVSARVSLPYTAAVRLCRGHVDPEDFSPETLSDGEIQALMERIRIEEIPNCDAGPFGSRGSTVRICLKDGRTRTASASAGQWNRLSPPTDSELIEKFQKLSAKALKKQRQEALIQGIFSFEQAGSLENYWKLACISDDGRSLQ